MNIIRFPIIATLFLSLFACSPAVDEDALTIVAVFPFTGGNAARGPTHLNAMRTAIDELERAGAIDLVGKPIRIETVNSGVSPEDKMTVLEKVEEIIAAKKVIAIFSNDSTGQQYSFFPAVEQKIPHFELALGTHHSEFFQPNLDHPAKRYAHDRYDESYAFTARGLCFSLSVVAGRFIRDTYPGKRIALMRGDASHDILHTTTVRSIIETSNQALEDAAVAAATAAEADALRAQKITIVNSAAEEEDTRYFLSYEVGSYEEEIKAMIADKNPDVIFYHLLGNGFNLEFMQDLESAGFDDGIRDPTAEREKTIVTCDMSQNSKFIDPQRNGFLNGYLHNRLFFVNRGPVDTPELQQFSAEYKAQWQIAPDKFTSVAYDATVLVGLAAAQVGVNDAGDIDHTALRDAILAIGRSSGTEVRYNELAKAKELLLAGTQINYEGASGSLDFSDKNTVLAEYKVSRTDAINQEFVVLTDWAKNGQSIVVEDALAGN